MARQVSGNPGSADQGETEEEARANAVDCVIAALQGYLKASKALPRQGASQTGRHRAVLSSS